MLNRNIPLYEGNQPYLYACYSPEDELLVLPILARMYNEGFRLWSASIAEKTSDFVAVRHVSTSACVVMFMSHSMIERINSGVPEVLAACRSSLLRTVVLLDDARPDNRLFALTSPERVEYQRSNDAAFWLFAYSADYLERCRGSWPEVKLDLREPVFEDVHQEVIAEEYISLEKIIVGGGSLPEKAVAPERYPNNKGYIQPAPDGLTYEPLNKVEAARTVHDRDYDDALALLNQCAEKQVEIIINRTRPGENTVPARPTLSPIMPMPDKQAELRNIREQLAASEQPVERPERRIDPEVRTKADMVVEPEDKPEPEQPEMAEALPEINVLLPEELSASNIAASIEKIAAAAEESPAEQGVPEEIAVEEIREPEGEPVALIVDDEDRSEIMPAEISVQAASGKTTVQVVVRKPQPAVRVTPVRKRVITEPARPAAENTSHRPRLSRSHFGGHLRSSNMEGNIAFEQYVRDIALAAVSTENPAEEAAAPVSHRRFGRASRTAAVAAGTTETAAVTVTAVPVQSNEADIAAEVSAEAITAEKTSARKSRYPHNSAVLAGLLAALRRERAAEAAETQEEEPACPAAEEAEPELAQELPCVQRQDSGDVKVIRLSDAISERKVSDLQAAVNKFMSIEPAPRVTRVYGIRR